MKKEIIYKLTENFEDFLHQTEDGIEFWFARDLQHLLGYNYISTLVECMKIKQSMQ